MKEITIKVFDYELKHLVDYVYAEKHFDYDKARKVLGEEASTSEVDEYLKEHPDCTTESMVFCIDGSNGTLVKILYRSIFESFGYRVGLIMREEIDGEEYLTFHTDMPLEDFDKVRGFMWSDIKVVDLK